MTQQTVGSVPFITSTICAVVMPSRSGLLGYVRTKLSNDHNPTLMTSMLTMMAERLNSRRLQKLPGQLWKLLDISRSYHPEYRSEQHGAISQKEIHLVDAESSHGSQ